MAGPPHCLEIRELLEGQPSLTFALGGIGRAWHHDTHHGHRRGTPSCSRHRACMVAVCEASGVLASSRESTFDDLLACLRHRGLPAETGACALYVRTRRPRRDDTLASFIMAHADWAAYLRERGFISQA